MNKLDDYRIVFIYGTDEIEKNITNGKIEYYGESYKDYLHNRYLLDYVKEKYLFAGILLLIGLIVSMIMWYITAVIKTGNIAWDDWMSCCIGGVTAGLMMVAVALPAQLKFGPERGRIALVTIVLLAVALGILMQEFTKGTKFAQSAKRILNQIDKLGTKGILGVIVIIWVIVGVISMIISMRVMEKREF